MEEEFNLILQEEHSNMNPMNVHWKGVINMDFFQVQNEPGPRLTDNCCPIDHSMDSEVVSSYYKVVKKYSLPWSRDTYLETVHKCHLSEISASLSLPRVGDGRNAAVIYHEGRHIGPVLINSVKQAEAICDVVTCLVMDQPLGEVSVSLLGSEIVRYLCSSL